MITAAINAATMTIDTKTEFFFMEWEVSRFSKNRVNYVGKPYKGMGQSKKWRLRAKIGNVAMQYSSIMQEREECFLQYAGALCRSGESNEATPDQGIAS